MQSLHAMPVHTAGCGGFVITFLHACLRACVCCVLRSRIVNKDTKAACEIEGVEVSWYVCKRMRIAGCAGSIYFLACIVTKGTKAAFEIEGVEVGGACYTLCTGSELMLQTAG
jgi:hypothetical protein